MTEKSPPWNPLILYVLVAELPIIEELADFMQQMNFENLVPNLSGFKILSGFLGGLFTNHDTIGIAEIQCAGSVEKTSGFTYKCLTFSVKEMISNNFFQRFQYE